MQVGACIVSEENVILGIGYNGFPRGCADTKLPWAKLSQSGNALDTKYPYVCHAELNAVLNKNSASLHGAVQFADSCRELWHKDRRLSVSAMEAKSHMPCSVCM